MMKNFTKKSFLILLLGAFTANVWCADERYLNIFDLEAELPAIFNKVYKTNGSEQLQKEGDLFHNGKPLACFVQFKPKNIGDKFFNLIVFEDISPEEMKEFIRYYDSISNHLSESTGLLSSLTFRLEQADGYEEYVHVNKLFSCREYMNEHKDQDFILAGKRNGAALALLFKVLFHPHAKEHQFKLILFQTPRLEASFSNFLDINKNFNRSYEDIMVFNHHSSKKHGNELGILVQVDSSEEWSQFPLLSQNQFSSLSGISASGGSLLGGSSILAYFQAPHIFPLLFDATGVAFSVAGATFLISLSYTSSEQKEISIKKVIEAYLRAIHFAEQGVSFNQCGLKG